MKKVLSMAVLFLGLSAVTFAQERGKENVKRTDKKHVVKKHEGAVKSPEELAKIRTERLDKTLKFTDKQRKEVYALNLEQAKKQHEHKEIRSKEMEARRKEMKANQEKFKNILTPEQQKILADNVKYKMENRREGRFNKGKDGERPHRRFSDKKVESTNS